MVAMHKRSEIILTHNGFRDDGDGDTHILIFVHGRFKVKIFQIGGHELGVGRGNDAVEKDFDGGEIGGSGADISVVDDLVSADGETDAAGIGFFGTKGSDDA